MADCLRRGPLRAWNQGREATRVRLRCDHFFGRRRRAAATIAPAAAITSSVRRVSPPKMTSATPVSTTAASAFGPGCKCRRAAGCRGGSLVSMSFTSTNTGSNRVLFTGSHLVGRAASRQAVHADRDAADHGEPAVKGALGTEAATSRPSGHRWREHLMSPIRDSRSRADVSRSDPVPCKVGRRVLPERGC